MIAQAIEKIVDKQDLTREEAYQVMNEIMDGKTSPVQNAAFLAALSTKSSKAETAEEIAGCAAAMREHALGVDTGMDVLEIVGTGGDHAGTINISTISAILCASAGAKVAKHGNRAASSQCGTADCLEALGISIDQSPADCLRYLDEVGMCFLFAQKYHSSMRYVGPIRKELGIRTVFNILGPLTNPARPKYMLLGVYDSSLLVPISLALKDLGVVRALIVHGQDGLDEISLSASTDAVLLENGELTSITIDPQDYGFALCRKEDLKGGNPQTNAEIARQILSGTLEGPKKDAVMLNAGAALYAAGLASTIEEGIALARNQISSGAALETLGRLISISEDLALRSGQ